ncbi:MAG TPA: hypothetical protein VFN22_00610 [Gemmatimonadales bacterium]|nr:hypothetical protein [Gemmatimonadales bacterium]
MFPEATTMLHWGMPDPAAVEDPGARRKAFTRVARELDARIAGLLGGWS